MVIPKKISKDNIVDLFTKIMLGERGHNSDGWQPFPTNILVVEEKGGRREMFLADDDKVLQSISIEGVSSEIIRYKNLHDDSTILIDYRLAETIAKTYLVSATPISDVKLVRELDDPGYCYFRQPYTLLENIDVDTFCSVCPLFCDWLQRVSLNRDALVRFIGSIFDINSYNQQYLIIKGSGGDGKGAFLNCLSNFFGPIYSASFTSRILDRDWTSTTYKKRVVAFPDAQALKFLNFEVFKAITGANEVPYRNLYQKEFTGISDAKFIICTNEDADITGMLSDNRRRIYCEISPPKGTTENYQSDLLEESQVFFSYCYGEYLKHCSKDQPIETDESVELYLEENSYDDFDSFFEQYLAPNGSVKRCQVNQIFKAQVSKDGKMFRRFKEYLKKVHGVQEIRMDGNWRLQGICIRSSIGLIAYN